MFSVWCNTKFKYSPNIVRVFYTLVWLVLCSDMFCTIYHSCVVLCIVSCYMTAINVLASNNIGFRLYKYHNIVASTAPRHNIRISHKLLDHHGLDAHNKCKKWHLSGNCRCLVCLNRSWDQRAPKLLCSKYKFVAFRALMKNIKTLLYRAWKLTNQPWVKRSLVVLWNPADDRHDDGDNDNVYRRAVTGNNQQWQRWGKEARKIGHVLCVLWLDKITKSFSTRSTKP